MKRWARAIARGIARITLWPQPLPNRYARRDPVEADAEALASDWRAVGHDLRAAATKLKRDNDSVPPRDSGRGGTGPRRPPQA